MRLQATIDIFLPHESVLRSPTLWERARRAFGGKIDLTTDRARVAIQTTALIDQVRVALKRMGINNAVSLVIDDTIIYSDTDGKPDDLGDLMIAFSEHAPVFGGTFRSLRFAVEHETAGLHALIETHCTAEHPKDEPAAKVRVGARVQEFEARPSESAESYRDRVTPLITNPTLFEGHRRQFEAFVLRLVDALRVGFPEGHVVEKPAEAKVVRPTAETPNAHERPLPGHPAYDPYAYYYPSPFEGMLSGMLIGSFLSSAFHPPHILVVHPSGAPIASADELDAHRAELADDAPDPGFSSEDHDHDGDGFGGDDFGDDDDVDGGDLDNDGFSDDGFGGDFGIDDM